MAPSLVSRLGCHHIVIRADMYKYVIHRPTGSFSAFLMIGCRSSTRCNRARALLVTQYTNTPCDSTIIVCVVCSMMRGLTAGSWYINGVIAATTSVIPAHTGRQIAVAGKAVWSITQLGCRDLGVSTARLKVMRQRFTPGRIQVESGRHRSLNHKTPPSCIPGYFSPSVICRTVAIWRRGSVQ